MIDTIVIRTRDINYESCMAEFFNTVKRDYFARAIISIGVFHWNILADSRVELTVNVMYDSRIVEKMVNGEFSE